MKGYRIKLALNHHFLGFVLGTAIMAAMDVTLPNNNAISKKYNITGFPTLIYFESGVMQYAYPGENNKASLINFLKDPKPEAEEKPKEAEWKDEPSEVHHLTGELKKTIRDHS